MKNLTESGQIRSITIGPEAERLSESNWLTIAFQTEGSKPTDAEVQAMDDQVEALSERLKASP